MRTPQELRARAQILAKISLYGMLHVAGEGLRGLGPDWEAFLDERGLRGAVAEEEQHLILALHEGRGGRWGNAASWACEPLAVLGWCLGHGSMPPFDEPSTPSRWIDRVLEDTAPRATPPSAEALQQTWRRMFWIHRRMHAFVHGVQRLDLAAWMARSGADPEALDLPLRDGDLLFEQTPLSEWRVWDMEYQKDQLGVTGGRLRALRWVCGAQPAWELVPTCPHELEGDPRCSPGHAYVQGTPCDDGLDARGGLAAHRALSEGLPPERWPQQALDALDIGGRDLLEHALFFGLSDAIPGLSALGADLEGRDGGLQTPLLRALRYRQPEVAQALLTLGADPSAVDARQQGALHWAACGGLRGPLRRLVGAGLDVDARSESGFTPLGLALTNGHDAAAVVLIKAGAALEAVTGDGRPAVHVAARGALTGALAALLKKGADPDVADSQGQVALHFAANLGHVEVVEQLCRAGADPDARTIGGVTPLIAAAWGQGEAAVMALIQGGAELDLAEPGRGGTALHYAAEGLPEAVRALLWAGAEPRPKDKQGQTPLQWARRAEDAASAALLRGATEPKR